MKKKISMLLMTAMLVGSFTACGSKPEEVVATPESVIEGIAEETSDETTLGYVKPEATEVVEETPEEFVLTGDYATEKMDAFFDAYIKLINTTTDDNPLAKCSAYTFETSVVWDTAFSDLTSKDGVQFIGPDNCLIGFDLVERYYDYQINNNGDPIDVDSFDEYYQNHNFADIQMCDFDDDMRKDTNTVFLRNCRFANYLTLSEGSDPAEIVLSDITDNITVASKDIAYGVGNTVTAAWQCKVFKDGQDTGLIMLFDEDGNFINFNDDNITFDSHDSGNMINSVFDSWNVTID